MYEYIIGSIQYAANNLLVIENNNIGYKIITSNHTIQTLNDSVNVKIYTYLYVREDEMSLYGFKTKDELDLFKLLLSVSKIGPKAGINMMSTLTSNEIKSAIVNENAELLSKAPGVGSKTAKRIILELKDKIKNSNHEVLPELDNEKSDETDEAKSALLSLGYTNSEINKVLSKVSSNSKDVTDIIKIALKELSK